jgi:tRNA (mo5U34)-methyltransferase
MYSKEEKQEMVNSVKYWWHSIDFGGGIISPGQQGGLGCNHTFKMIEQIELPKDLTGKTILDCGCADGFFSFECERRGAKKVVALDVPHANCEKGFRVAHKIFNSNVEYLQEDYFKLGDIKFDIVLYLGIQYHLRYQIKALEILKNLFKELAIIETYYYSDNEKSYINYYPPQNKYDHCTWQPTEKCLEEWFKLIGFNYSKKFGQDTRIVYHLK